MAEVLTQDEIDQLLTAINEGDIITGRRFGNGFASLEEFENHLISRKPEQDRYGMFDKDVTMVTFSLEKNGEEILADIERKNAEENMGNIAIPGTKIKLINFSLCPTCKKVFSYKDLADYYANPKKDTRYENLKEQFRNDTRIY